MPRDLGDVLHYFMPELESRSEAGDPSSLGPPGRGASIRATSEPIAELPIIGVPIGERDVVRAALTWNLAVETARLGGRAVVLAPESDRATPLWPESGVGPLGTEVVFCNAENLDDLCLCARTIARPQSPSPSSPPSSPPAPSPQTGGVFVRVPSEWLAPGTSPHHSIAWWLLISSPDHRDLSESYELARTIQQGRPSSRIGVTIHGVSKVSEARRAFEHLARRCETGLGLDLASYGLLVDDLHVYRAIVAQRPIGLAHPQAPATLALMDVARLIAEDARRRLEGADPNG